MYCKGCGTELAEQQEICMKCGVPRGKGKAFCQYCGQPINENAVICVHCGASIAEKKQEEESYGEKSQAVAFLLGFFLGGFGAHNFYLDFKKRAIAQLLLTIFGIFLISFSMVGVVITAASYEMVTEIAIFATLGMLLGFAMIGGVWIWSFVEALVILCNNNKLDGHGKRLRG